MSTRKPLIESFMKEFKDLYLGQVGFRYIPMLNLGSTPFIVEGHYYEDLSSPGFELIVSGSTPVSTLPELKESIKKTFYEES